MASTRLYLFGIGLYLSLKYIFRKSCEKFHNHTFKLFIYLNMSNTIYMHTYLLSKRSGLGDFKSSKKITVSDKIRLIDKHASVEI